MFEVFGELLFVVGVVEVEGVFLWIVGYGCGLLEEEVEGCRINWWFVVLGVLLVIWMYVLWV